MPFSKGIFCVAVACSAAEGLRPELSQIFLLPVRPSIYSAPPAWQSSILLLPSQRPLARVRVTLTSSCCSPRVSCSLLMFVGSCVGSGGHWAQCRLLDACQLGHWIVMLRHRRLSRNLADSPALRCHPSSGSVAGSGTHATTRLSPDTWAFRACATSDCPWTSIPHQLCFNVSHPEERAGHDPVSFFCPLGGVLFFFPPFLILPM